MGTTALSTLIDRLSQRTGDYLSETVTTALAANTTVTCTTLNEYTAQNDKYNRQWVYITDKANAGEYRKLSDSTTTALTVLGANWTTDGANKATFEIHKYDRRNKIRAINLAARKAWPYLFRILRDTTLTSNNIVPNPSFENWEVSSSSPDDWAYSGLVNATAAKNATVGYGRGISANSMKLTASAANGYHSLHSDTYPKLLDLMGKTISGYVWAYPEVADDATIVFYTKQADGTAQTLTSTTVTPAGEFSLIKLENQKLNTDLSEVSLRIKVETNAKYVYFDNFRVTGIYNHEYILPTPFQSPTAKIDNIQLQTTSAHDYYQDDLMANAKFEPLYGWEIKDDASTKYLITPTLETGRHFQIEGHSPLEDTLSAATDTMTIEDPQIDLLIELAASILFDLEAGLPSASDRDWLKEESYKYLASYEYMKGNLKMRNPRTMTKFDARIL